MKEREIFEQFLQVSNVEKEDVIDYRSCTEFYADISLPNTISIQLSKKYKNKEIIYTASDIDTVVNELRKIKKLREELIKRLEEEKKIIVKKENKFGRRKKTVGKIIGLDIAMRAVRELTEKIMKTEY